jgi:formylglycine-generating enzyme required for sulfatase activity
MGSNEGKDDEQPPHQVTVSDFYMGKYEVTVAQFKAFIDASGYRTDAEKGNGSIIWTGSEWKRQSGVNWKCDLQGIIRPQSEYNHPVINVSWNDATAYCEWLSQKTGKSYRLPTEAEWEYAAGNGTQHTKYSWGSGTPYGKQGGNVADETAKAEFGETAIFDNYTDGFSFTAPVGSFNPNTIGLYDMTGNVNEWCSDCYGSSPQSNPQGSASDCVRVFRGGSWDDDPQDCRVSSGYCKYPEVNFNFLGFRVVISP